MKKLLIILPIVFIFNSCTSLLMKQQTKMLKQQQEQMDLLIGTVAEEDMALEVINPTTLRTIFDVDSPIENSKDKILIWQVYFSLYNLF